MPLPAGGARHRGLLRLPRALSGRGRLALHSLDGAGSWSAPSPPPRVDRDGMAAELAALRIRLAFARLQPAAGQPARRHMPRSAVCSRSRSLRARRRCVGPGGRCIRGGSATPRHCMARRWPSRSASRCCARTFRVDVAAGRAGHGVACTRQRDAGREVRSGFPPATFDLYSELVGASRGRLVVLPESAFRCLRTKCRSRSCSIFCASRRPRWRHHGRALHAGAAAAGSATSRGTTTAS